MLKYIRLFIFLFLCSSFLIPVILKQAKASSLGESFIYFSRMQEGQQTEILTLLTPRTNFNSPNQERILKIIFSGSKGEWCKVDGGLLDVKGIESTVIDISNWSIDTPFPAQGEGLEAKCFKHTGGDYIEIRNVGSLVSNTRYGLEIASSPNFSLKSVGNHLVSLQLIEGTKVETITLSIPITLGDSPLVTAYVIDTSTISCTLSHSSLSFGTLPKNDSYISIQHTAVTSANFTEGYYWAVYGQGDGNEAGLWKSTSPTSLIPSSGNTTLNLNNVDGFGLTVASSNGTVAPNFSNSHPGVFGAINSGYQNPRMIFWYIKPELDPITKTMTFGVKAGATAEAGAYSETITYVCGGFY